jgi:hypothetical protein
MILLKRTWATGAMPLNSELAFCGPGSAGIPRGSQAASQLLLRAGRGANLHGRARVARVGVSGRIGLERTIRSAHARRGIHSHWHAKSRARERRPLRFASTVSCRCQGWWGSDTAVLAGAGFSFFCWAPWRGSSSSFTYRKHADGVDRELVKVGVGHVGGVLE